MQQIILFHESEFSELEKTEHVIIFYRDTGVSQYQQLSLSSKMYGAVHNIELI
jgi:hypothetical protein